MRIAIFSDVHGNRFALESVLRDIERHKPDVIANLGDQVWGAADPAGAWQLQVGLGSLQVRGNTDEFVASELDALTGETRNFASWLRDCLPDNVPSVLEQLPLTQELAAGEIVIAHGALHDTWAALLFEAKNGRFIPRDDDSIMAQLGGFPKARVFVVGHTHRELLRSFGGLTLINTGPVSRYLDGYSLARWLLLEQRQGHWQVNFRRVPYDVQAAVDWAMKHSPFGSEETRLLMP